MQDPLNIEIDLAGVETSLPLLPTDAPVRVQVVESKIELNKDKNGYNWNLVLATTEPLVATDGRDVAPGFKLFNTVALQARPDSKDPEAFRRSLGETIDAIFGTDKSNRPAFNKDLVDNAMGKTCLAQVSNEEWQGNTSTKIRRLKPESTGM